jgi:adenosylmethionine-8-amino-7-oxononanoate aminotransferase
MVAHSKIDLRAADEAHLIHPLFNPAQHRAQGPIILVRGRGAILEDIDGKHYIDGLSGLWNVNCGHGRVELAEAAARRALLSHFEYRLLRLGRRRGE